MQAPIQVYEHEILKIGQKDFKAEHFEALSRYHGEKGCSYFSLVNKGVKFCEYVGVIQIDGITIEVLPKIDSLDSKAKCQDILIKMLRSINSFKPHAPSSASLKLHKNSVLDLYFEMFVVELEMLFRKGLLKKYRKVESNSDSLNGSLLFGKHISKNYIHKERFYVRHTAYDENHTLNQILLKTISLLKRINTNPHLSGRIRNLYTFMPEVQDITTSERIFGNLKYSRKSKVYRGAIEIARLLLMNYHPDVTKGKNNVLALMFDMNVLWEKFVYLSLRRQLRDYEVKPQSSKDFWQKTTGYKSTVSLRPDIVIEKDGKHFVLDTKWKLVEKHGASIAELRQMFAYSHYFEADKTALFYPATESNSIHGKFCNTVKTCSILKQQLPIDFADWQVQIGENVSEWIAN